MSNVGFATLQIIPSARGFGAALNSQTNTGIAAAGAAGGKKFGSSMMGGMLPLAKSMGVIGGGLAVGGIITNSINLEKQFSQTMNTMAAVADVPKPQIKELSDLAMKMGADTVFSANDAADAMLELAKGGLDTATIKAGALASTLTLATAGGLELGNAATYIGNSLNTFHLAGKDAAAVAAALAGGANASSASVESLGQALSQVGPGAVNAGLSIQETVAALAAFDNAGIKGSDAGTSLKTMLARLVPQTDKAKSAMAELGINFINADGSFKSIADIAGILKDKLGGLTEAQKSQALTTLFGSDASRAAAVLMDQGKEGIDKYTKATSDLEAAQRVADSRMQGTAGAIEAMKGSIETAQLAFGKLLAPAVTAGAKGIAAAFNGVTNAVNTIVPGVRALYDLVVKGDFTGAFSRIFHVSEDSPVVGVIFRIRDGLTGLYDLIVKGDLTGAFTRAFNIEEDSPIVGFLLGVHDALARLGPVISTVASFIGANLKPILIGFGVALAAIGLPIIFGLIGSAIGAVVGVIGALVAVVASPIVVIAALVAGVIYAYGHFETFRNVVDTVVSFVTGTLLPGFISFAGWLIETLVPVITGLAGTFASVFTAIFNTITSVLGWVRDKISQFVGWAAPTFKVFMDFLAFYVPLVFGILKGAFEIGFGVIKAIFTVALGVIKAVWTVAWSVISGVLKVAWTLISGIIEGALQIVGGIIRTALALLTGNWTQAWEGIKGILRGAWTLIETAVKAGIQVLLTLFKDLPVAVVKALGNIGMALYDAGKDLLMGMVNGVKDMVGALGNAVKDAVGGAISDAKGLLGINSPSRVFHEIGAYTGEGFVNGIAEMTDTSQRAMAAMVAPPSIADMNAEYGATYGSSSVAGETANVADAVESLAEGIEALRAEVRRQTDRGVLLTKTGVTR